MISFAALLILILSFLLLKFRKSSLLLLLFLPTLFWVVGSGTYSGQQSEMNISIFPITVLGALADIKNMRFNKIEVLVECYSLFFGILILFAFKRNTLNNIKNNLLRYSAGFFRSKAAMMFTILVFIFSIYQCLTGDKQDISVYSNYALSNGLYVKGSWDCFGSLSRIFIDLNYHEDIVFYSFLYLLFFYALLYIFFKNQNKSVLCSTAFIVLFPIVSVGNNLFNYKGETTKDSRAIVVYPLSHALSATAISFYEDYKLQKAFNEEQINKYKSFHSSYDSLTKVKFYSLFQIITVLLLLPSILILKEEKNAE